MAGCWRSVASTVGSKCGTLLVWDVHTGQLASTLSGHTDQILSVDLSPDGVLAATASADHIARVWDARSGNLLDTINSFDGAVTSIRFFAGGTRRVATSADHSAKVWEVRRETRSPADIDADPRCRVPFVFEHGRIVPRATPPADCAH